MSQTKIFNCLSTVNVGVFLVSHSLSVSHHVTMHVITFKTSFLLTIQLDHTLHKSLQLNERKREKWSKTQRRLGHEWQQMKVENVYENKILTVIKKMIPVCWHHHDTVCMIFILCYSFYKTNVQWVWMETSSLVFKSRTLISSTPPLHCKPDMWLILHAADSTSTLR